MAVLSCCALLQEGQANISTGCLCESMQLVASVKLNVQRGLLLHIIHCYMVDDQDNVRG
jgi:hypothetical protein